jgi:uncharacterized RDD family membrane protein YckC
MNDFTKYKTFWQRFVAGIIDGLVFIPLMIADYFIYQEDNITLFIAWRLINTFCWMTYIVIGHGKYGQTLGKKVMRIKVLDIDEQKMIGYSRAFFRESVWLIAEISGIIYLIYLSSATTVTDRELIKVIYEDYMSFTTLGWLLLELLTMLFNKKRRALHDYIAGSVVVKI